MSVTVAVIKGHIETDRDDTVLQRLIDDANDDIVTRYGSPTSRTEDWIVRGPRRRLWLPEPAISVTAAQEGPTIDDLTTLTVTIDYLLVESNWVIERVGGNWGNRVRIEWVPRNDVARRDRVAIDLVRLSLSYSALTAQREGDFSSTHPDYQLEREKILSGLNGGKMVFA